MKTTSTSAAKVIFPYGKLLISYDTSNSTFKINDSPQHKEFEDLEKLKFFTAAEMKLITTWSSDKEGEEFLTKFTAFLTAEGLKNTKKRLFKYVLFSQSLEQEYIFNYLKTELLHDFTYLDQIQELMNLQKYSDQDKLTSKCFDLIFKTMDDENFIEPNESKRKLPYDKSYVPKIDKYINILIGKLESGNKKLTPLKIKLNEEQQIKRYEYIAKCLTKIVDHTKDRAKLIYMDSLNVVKNDKNLKGKIKFIEYFAECPQYKEFLDKIQTKYTELYKEPTDDIEKDSINDLFAYKLFNTSKEEWDSLLFTKFPFWLVVKIGELSGETKKNSLAYYDIVKGETYGKNVPISLLEKKFTLAGPDSDQLKKYFAPAKSTEKDKKLKFAVDKTVFAKFTKSGNEGKALEDIIIKLVTERINVHKIFEETTIQSNKDLLDQIEKRVMEEFDKVETSFKNKDIFKNAKAIKSQLEKDLFNNKEFSIDPVEYNIPQTLNSILQNKKNIPQFINTLPFNEDYILNTVTLKEPFLQEEYIKSVVQKIMKISKLKRNIELIKSLNEYVEKEIILLNLLNNFYTVISKITGDKCLNFPDTSKLTREQIIQQEFNRLISKISPQMFQEENKLEDFPTLMKYTKELSRRINITNKEFLNLQLFELFIDSSIQEEKNKLLKGESCVLYEFLDKFISNEITSADIQNDKLDKIGKFVETDKAKFKIRFLIICYNKLKLLKKDEQFKDVTNSLLSEEQCLMETALLYERIVEDLIPIKTKSNDNPELEKNFFDSIDSEAIKIFSDEFMNCMSFNSLTPPTQYKSSTIKNIQFLLIQSIEKHLLKIFSKRNFIALNKDEVKEVVIENCFELVEKLNNRFKETPEQEDNVELFKQFVAVAGLRVFFQTYLEMLNSGVNTSYIIWINEHLSDYRDNDIVRLIKFYILKLIRNKYCTSFREFQSFDFSGKQMDWVTDIKFSTKIESEFEYLFFSFWNEPNRFQDCSDFLKDTFIPLKVATFRTSNYDDACQDFIKNDFDLYIDIIMNRILCHTWSNDYLNKLEFVEFSSWSSTLVKAFEQSQQLPEEQIKYLSLISIYNKECYHKIIESLKQLQNTEDIDINNLEIVFIALKLVLVFILKEKQIESLQEIPDEDDVQNRLIKKLYNFIIYSQTYYKEFKCETLIQEFHEIQNLLRRNNINQIKLFINFLYYRMKQNLADQEIMKIIESAVKDWPNQESFVNYYYERELYKEETIRNLLLEERFTPDAADGRKCNINNDSSELIIPSYYLFYYEELPIWENFVKKCKEQILKEQTKYPYLSYFVQSTQEDKRDTLYGKQINSKEIKDILKTKTEGTIDNKYYDFRYSKFKTLDELIAYYSKSYVLAQKEANANLGYLVEYDIQGIENELSSIEYLIVEQNKQK